MWSVMYSPVTNTIIEILCDGLSPNTATQWVLSHTIYHQTYLIAVLQQDVINKEERSLIV